MKLLHKTLTFNIKAVDDEQGLIEAYGSVFNVVDQGDDLVRPGAFKRTIQNSKSRVQSGKATFLIPMLWQHDPNNPIGGWYDLTEDSHGLKAKGKIILATKLGQDIYNLIKERVLDQFSIGYDIPQGGSSYNSKEGYRELKEIRLWEISVVTFAMNTDALLTGVKSHDILLKSKKDFYDHYRQQTIEDWLYSDFRNLLCSLKASLIDAFMIGDSPQEDLLNTILQDNSDGKMGFIKALEDWVQKGTELNASAYLQETLEAHGVNGLSGAYGYMGRQEQNFMDTKAGRAISAANADTITQHIATVKDMSNKALQMAAQHFKDMQEHHKSMSAAADDLATVLQGSEPAYGTDTGDPAPGQEQGKSAPYLSAGTRAEQDSSDKDTPNDTELEDALSILRDLRTKFA